MVAVATQVGQPGSGCVVKLVIGRQAGLVAVQGAAHIGLNLGLAAGKVPYPNFIYRTIKIVVFICIMISTDTKIRRLEFQVNIP